jgi:phage terminase small subunit
MVEIDYQRSVADRLAGRRGRAVRLVVHGENRDLELRQGRKDKIDAEVRQVVRGVAISRRSVGMEDWLQALAQEVARAAARDTAARQALERLLRG